MRKRLYIDAWVPCLVLVLFAVASRLLPHPPNLTAVGALGLYAGAVMRGPGVWLAPPLALLLSDAFLGYYNPLLMAFVYSASVAAVPCARLSWLPACGAAAVVFFTVSNLGVWLATDLYEPTASGLAHCYWAALPFFANTLLGNLAYYPAMLYATAYGRKLAL